MTNTSDLSKKVESQLGQLPQIQPAPLTWERVPVAMQAVAEGPFAAYAQEVTHTVNNLSHTGSVISEDEMMFYLAAMVRLRVAYVNNEATKEERDAYRSGLPIPSFFSLVISHIGKASDQSMGIEVYPQFEHNINFDVVNKVANALRVANSRGFTCALEFPRDTRGDFDFMTMQLIDSQIVSETHKPHGSAAVFASITRNQLVKSVLTGRISYGDIDMFASLVRQYGRL